MSPLEDSIRDRAMKDRREALDRYEKLRVAAQAVVDAAAFTKHVVPDVVTKAIDGLRVVLDG